MQTQRKDTQRPAETARDATSEANPGAVRNTDERGDELIDIGGVTVYRDGLAHAILDALDDEFT